jgi:Peptidase_C39 like family
MWRQVFLRLVSCAALTTAAAAGADLATATELATTLRGVLIEGVPHVKQKPDFCGEACAEMYLTKLGKAMDQDYVFDQAGVDPLLGRGCHTRELATALRRIGFRTGNVWYVVTPSNAQQQLDSQFGALHKDLAAGVPSIICMRYDDHPNTTEHFRLILGYDARSDEVIFHEPAVNQGAYRRMKRDQLLALWPLKYAERQWTVVRLRLEPGKLADGRAASTLTDADYAQHIRQLKHELLELREKQVQLKAERDAEIEAEKEKQKLIEEAGEEYEPHKFTPRTIAEFQIVLQRPFVVIGDDSTSAVRRHAQGTVRWAVDRLKQDYFSQDPDHVINIWLFQDKSSYEQNTVDIFGRRPNTPFGYYSARDKALVMNIETGGGTLVHEIVHPLVAANFPECPSWLNEGLGSLYEQCQDRNGHIHGLTNWRLHGLHESLKDENYKMPTFEELLSTSTREFYEEDPGTNYAQARYLLYYLQEQGLLVTFYHEFRRSAQDDPTGYATLCKVLGRKKEDMDAFQKEWTEYVLALRF